jgi:hypothetical protein
MRALPSLAISICALMFVARMSSLSWKPASLYADGPPAAERQASGGRALTPPDYRTKVKSARRA